MTRWLCLSVVLLACGDDAGPSPGARGTVVLPAGAALDASALTVVSAVAEARPSASGAFEIYMLDPEPSEVELLTADGKLVMIGLMADQGGEVSAHTTAAALLAQSLGAAALPAEHQRTLRALLAEVPELEGLSDAISAAIVASPTALADGDPTIVAALQTAHDAALGDTDRPAREGRALSDAGTDLLIEPAAAQSGVEVLQSPTSTGVVAQNSFRRPAAMIVYRVAEDDADGMKVDVTPPVEVARVDVVSSGKLELFTALSDVVLGDAPFAPSITAPLRLALAASGKRAYYEAVVLGPTLDLVTRPAIYDDLRFTALQGEWDGVVADKGFVLFFGEIVMPLCESFVFGRSGLIAGGALDSVSKELRRISQAPLGPLTALVQSKLGFSTALSLILDELVSNPVYRRAVIQLLIDAAPTAARASLVDIDKKLVARASAAAVVAAIQLVFASGDVVAIVKDLHDSTTAAAWQITATPAVVHLDPSAANVDKNSSQVQLSVTVRDQPGPFAYRWSTSGSMGYVNDYSHSGASVEGTSDKAFYQVENPINIVDGSTDTVTVEVFPRSEAGGIAPGAVAIGKATAVITGKQRNLDSRFFVKYDTIDFRTGPQPCAVMFLRFPKDAAAKSYAFHFEGYGGVGDRDNNSNSYLVAEYSYDFSIDVDDPYVRPYDDHCYDTYGILAGFALSPHGNEYWLATYMAFEPFHSPDGDDLLSLGERVELWYEWLDQADVTVTAVH